MAGFGDNTTVFMRGGVIPNGGLRIEAGCWTQGTDASAALPTQLTHVIALVCSSAGPNEAACVSNSFIRADMAGTTSGKILNYIAIGW